MTLDSQTRRNLELYESGRWNSSSASLLSVLDFTKTPMGGRLFKRWISQPLLDLKQIIRRQEGVSWFHNNALRRERIISILRTIQDIERLTNRIRSFTANPRDLISLSLSLEAVPKLTTILSLDKDTSLIKHFTDEIQDKIISYLDTITELNDRSVEYLEFLPSKEAEAPTPPCAGPTFGTGSVYPPFPDES